MREPDYRISRPLPDAQIRVISLGAGVQSTVMALMAACQEIGPLPDAAIFADTGWEPQEVYAHLDWLETVLPFPVYRVQEGNLRSKIAAVRPRGQFLQVDVPAFVKTNGRAGGMVSRSCTQDYKIKPIRRQVRALLGVTGKRSPAVPVVEQWIGISRDEMQRMKDAREPWIKHRWPLIEQGMDRRDCLTWFEARYPGRALAKSACIGCPFHSLEEWRRVMADPVQRADAIEIDDKLRVPVDGKTPRATGELYLHRSCVPLRDIDFSALPADPQGDLFHGFANECEGMCGV